MQVLLWVQLVLLSRGEEHHQAHRRENGRNPVLRNREAPGDGRRLCPDTTVVIITQLPAIQPTNAT